MTTQDRPFIQLPNKDLWRGCVIQEPTIPAPDAEVVSEASQNPINRAMALLLKQAAGARELTCTWCGQQSDEKYMRKHLEDQHKSLLFPVSGSDAAMAVVAQQQKAKLEAAATAQE